MRRVLLGLLLLLVAAAPAVAGGGPETTLLVVNADSPVSRLIANEYVALRGVPSEQVVWLEGIPHLRVVSLELFRDRILAPVLEAIAARGLEGRIDCIAYSADFPYAVDLDAPLQGAQVDQGVTKVGSLTGLTFLARRVMAGELARAVGLRANQYYRRDEAAARRAARPPTQEELAHYTQATTALQRREFQAAADAFERFTATYDGHMESWYNYACCLARLRKPDEAIAKLRRAVECGWSDAKHAAADPDLESLRGRPEFRELLERMGPKEVGFQPSRGFSSAWGWDGGPDPVRDPDAGALDRYFLSVALAATGEWGNSAPEALACLRAAAASDGKRPAGTVYFCANDDVRARTREGAFAATIAELRKLGVNAERLDKTMAGQTGVLPVSKGEVAGAVVGSAGFDWAASGSRILPGAIVEHLTSFGAVFSHGSQTKLTEFLRHGAAGASGTVFEPYALQEKFPHPWIQVHYARGCSLAEAFYQSVWGPYQLLVVGDPLARPYATFRALPETLPPSPWSGTVELPQAEGLEIWIDGRPATGAPCDSTALDDGVHEVRVVSVEPGRIATRSGRTALVTVSNAGRSVTLQAPASVRYGQPIELKGKAAGAERVELLHLGRIVAEAKQGGGGFRLAVASERVGPGPALLRVRATFTAGPSALSAPLTVVVEPPALRKQARAADAPSLPGLLGTLVGEGGEPQEFVAATLYDEEGRSLRADLGPTARGRRLSLEGEFRAPRTGSFQLMLQGEGELKLAVDGEVVLDAPAAGGMACAYLGLEEGWHALAIQYTPRGEASLRALLGGDVVAQRIELRHEAPPLHKERPDAPGPFAELVDGKRLGAGLRVPPEGIELTFRKPARDLAGFLLIPAPGAKDSAAFPASWTVEVAESSGKWKPLAGVTQRTARPAAKAPGEQEVPAFVALRFKPMTAKRVRINPRGDGEAWLVEIEPVAKSPHR
ncbi:MAG: TPR end-of-group domain-containing protein [Planctomycetaceae bacterium]